MKSESTKYQQVDLAPINSTDIIKAAGIFSKQTLTEREQAKNLMESIQTLIIKNNQQIDDSKAALKKLHDQLKITKKLMESFDDEGIIADEPSGFNGEANQNTADKRPSTERRGL